MASHRGSPAVYLAYLITYVSPYGNKLPHKFMRKVYLLLFDWHLRILVSFPFTYVSLDCSDEELADPCADDVRAVQAIQAIHPR